MGLLKLSIVLIILIGGLVIWAEHTKANAGAIAAETFIYFIASLQHEFVEVSSITVLDDDSVGIEQKNCIVGAGAGGAAQT